MSQWPFSRRQFLTRSLVAAAVLDLPAGLAAPLSGPRGLRPIDFADVDIEDAFWSGPKMLEVGSVTLHACIYQTEQKSGRIRNFEKAARRSGESHEGIYYDDSDVYKALEAMAYSLKTHPDPALEARRTSGSIRLQRHRLPDGYLNTYFTLRGLDRRWTDMEKHEDYCAGHLIEAGVAYYRTTGKTQAPGCCDSIGRPHRCHVSHPRSSLGEWARGNRARPGQVVSPDGQ